MLVEADVTVKSSEFQKMKEDCLCCIQDALLQSQWQRAAELMISYLEMLENTSSEKRMTVQEVGKLINIIYLK